MIFYKIDAATTAQMKTDLDSKRALEQQSN